MQRLLNIENNWISFDGEDSYEGPEKLIMEADVMTALRKLKCHKSGGPTRLVVISLRLLICRARTMAMLFNKILFEENISIYWELSSVKVRKELLSAVYGK